MIFSASADLLNARGMIIPRALHKSADAEKITIKLLVTDIYITNFSQEGANTGACRSKIPVDACSGQTTCPTKFII